MNLVLDVTDEFLNKNRIAILDKDKYSIHQCALYDAAQGKELETYVLELNDKRYYISKEQYDYIEQNYYIDSQI